MINYMLQQISSMETNTVNQYKRATELTEKERDDAMQRMNDMKLATDNFAVQINDLTTKVMNLNAEQQRAEVTRQQLSDKLRLSEEQNAQMSNFIKSLQSQSESELAQMRNFLQTKLSEDHSNQVKAKEKSSILFNELVRIGHESTSQKQNLQNLNHQLE